MDVLSVGAHAAQVNRSIMKTPPPIVAAGLILVLRLFLLAAPAAAEIVTLFNGRGDGTVLVPVDPYGGFGENLHGDAVYDPVGATQAAGTVWASAVFFGPLGEYLTTGGNEFLAALPDIGFDSTTPMEVTSSFKLPGFTIELTQALQLPTAAGSVLTQTYRVHNEGVAETAVTLVRYLDGDLRFDGTLADSAGISQNGMVAFEFDTGDDPSNATTYVGIENGGGTHLGFSVQPYDLSVGELFREAIRNAGGIPPAFLDTIAGDSDGDRLTDGAQDFTLALQNTLTIPAGETAAFTTRTIFGAGTPRDLLMCKTDADCATSAECRVGRCTDGQCIEAPAVDGTICDDGDACTAGDLCAAGTCRGSTVDCDDGNGCTTDGCAPATGCVHAALIDGAECNDGNNCVADTCLFGQCIESSACLAIVVVERQEVPSKGAPRIETTCSGLTGEVCAAQAFVSVDLLAPASPQSVAAAQVGGGSLEPASAATSKKKCQRAKEKARKRIDEESRKLGEEIHQVGITNSVQRKIDRTGQATLELKLNPVGKCLLREAGADGLTVTVQASVGSKPKKKKPSGDDPETLRFLVQLVKKSQ